METQPREALFQQPLPELAKFTEPAIRPGLGTDVALATTPLQIHLLSTPESVHAARAYRHVVGRDITEFRISVDQNPIGRAMAASGTDEVKLVMHSATDPVLNARMFADGPALGQLLMGHIYVPSENHQSPNVHCVGATKHSLDLLSEASVPEGESLIREMIERRKTLLNGTLSNEDFRRILRSDSVRRIRAHALGPAGTNISQAMEEYVTALGITDKTDLIVHPKGIEPLAYAEQAREEVEEGVIPIHMECAVYYQMAELFNQRRDEVVFADHHDMLLDTMQLASAQPIDELAASGVMRIATHPSPRPLIDPWLNAGRAEWMKATSNSAAALMVLDPEGTMAPEERPDACITTGSGLTNAQGLHSRHVFGRPNMFFTIGTALNQAQLHELLKAA
ncbi:MAG: hypothetical protein HYV40_03495 [Candidatus Levybacteria bacterium]|nr:hypothetical protein [Candidatus Levybacteria bacterium]